MMKNFFLLCFLWLGMEVALGQTSIGNLPTFNSMKLSNTYVTALAEDEDGFLWIGTQKGLNRYNGSTYRIYSHQDSLSLASDNILSLYADTQNRLWVGTDAGINLIQDGRVVRRSAPIVDFIFTMDSFSDDALIFSDDIGLALYDKHIGQVKDSVVVDLDVSYSRHICCVDQYVCVAAQTKPVIHVYNRDFELHKKIYLPQGSTINDFTVHSNTFYVSTNRGLLGYSIVDDFSRQELSSALSTLTRDENVLFFHAASSSQLIYIGIVGKGLFSYNSVTGQFFRISAQDTLNDVRHCISLVTSQYLWFSRNSNPPEMFPLKHLRNAIVFDLHPGESITQIVGYGENIILACSGRSLYAYDAETMQIRNVTPEDLSTDQCIKKVLVDDDQYVWLLIDFNTIKKYAWQKGKLKLLKEVYVKQVIDILRNVGQGLYLQQEDKIVALDKEGKISGTYLIPPFISSKVLGQTNKGSIYFLGLDYVYRLSPEVQFIKMSFDFLLPYCFYESEDDKLWIGTFKSGLYCYDKRTKQTLHFSTENGLPDNTIRAVQGDAEGNIWVSMRNQISKISPDSGHVITYMENNLVNAFYSGNCSARDGKGNLYFTGNNFMTCISPFDNRPYYAGNIPLYLDGVIVNNKLVDYDGEGLVLNYDENQLTVYYSALYFNPNVYLNYSYLLEGYNEDWIFAGRSQYAIFFNLPSGNYRLRVRVQNPSGEWNANELVLPVRIKPHPLLSPWAKAVYAILAVLLILLAVWKSVRYRRRKEEQLVRETKRVMNEQLKQEKIDFFINISHEFRTPLSLIYAPAKELAERDSMSPDDSRLLATIEHNAEWMLRLSEQLLNFDRVDFEGKRLAVNENDLSLLVNASVENIRFLAEQKTIHLSVQTPGTLTAYYDREKVEKVLYNLLSNAIKYTPGNGSIGVGLKEMDATQARKLYKELVVPEGYEGSYAEISISDTGPGIAPKSMPKLFRRYERGVDTEGGPVGFGIGLDYAMQLAVLQKGMLRVTSELGKGSCFYFAFPIEKEAYGKGEPWMERVASVPSAPVTYPKDGSDGSEADGISILLVEDDGDMRSYLQGLLGREYQVQTASDGVEALDSLSMSMPDLIISDIMMPRMDGLTLCNEVKNNPELCHLPVVLLTAKTEADDLIRGLNYGADAYVRKPFDPQYLLVVIRNVLANRKRLQTVINRFNAPLAEEAGDKLGINPQDEEFLKKLYELTDRFLDNEDFNITSIAGELNISRSSFYSKIKTLTGQSPQLFLGAYRLNKAMELLKTGNYTVSEVCFKVGFNSVSGFSRSFKKKFGVSPSDVGK